MHNVINNSQGILRCCRWTGRNHEKAWFTLMLFESAVAVVWRLFFYVGSRSIFSLDLKNRF